MHKLSTAKDDGAEVFLVPADNCDEARTGRENPMKLVRVETLDGAVDALKTLTAGGQPPTC